MKLREIPQHFDFDVCNGYEDMELPTISTDGEEHKQFDQLLTDEGKEYFKAVLDLEVTKRGRNCPTYVVAVDNDKQSELLKLLCWGQAGYISETLYNQWFKEDGDDDEPERFECMECGAMITNDDGITTLSGRWVCDNDGCRTLDEENEAHDIDEQA